MPNFFEEAGQNVYKFVNVNQPESFIVDLRSKHEKMLIRENKSAYTFANKIDIWDV